MKRRTFKPVLPSARTARLFFFTWAMMILLSAPSAAGQSSPAGKEDPYRAAALLLEKGDLDGAEQALWQILNQQPEDARALCLLGQVRRKQERLPEAEALLKRAIQIDANLAEASVSLGSVHEAQGHTAKAVEAYERALSIQPKNVSVAARLAALLQASGDYEGSLASLRRIPPRARPADFLVIELADLLGLKQLAKARGLIPGILAPSRAADVPLACADQFLKHNLPDDALGVLRSVRARTKLSAYFHVLMGRAELQKGQAAAAEGSFHRALRLDPDSVEALRGAATLKGNHGEWEEAGKLLQHASRVAPNSPEVLRDLAFASLRAKHPSAAAVTLTRLLELRPGDADSQFLLCVALLDAGNEQGAQTAIEKYIAMRPEDPRGYVAFGTLEYQQGLAEQAQIHFEKALQLDSKVVEAYYYLGLLARNRGDLEKGVSILERAVVLDPRNSESLAVLGELYMRLGDEKRAENALQRAAELAPNAAAPHYQLALLYQRLGQRERAESEMNLYRKLHGREQSTGQKPEMPLSPAQGPPPH